MTADPYDVPGYDAPEPTPALGSVVEQGRGSLPFALIHGEALVACASWALGDAGVTPVDLGTEWAGLVASGEPFVLHDALCPMTPASFITECVRRAVETGEVVAGADGQGAVLSPVVLPAPVVASLGLDVLALAVAGPDFDALVAVLEKQPAVGRVHRLPAPAESARIRSEADVRSLELRTGQAAT